MQTGRERLRQWLDRAKLNQREAAKIINIDHTQLNQILTGQRRPGLDTAVKIEQTTGIVVEAWVPFHEDTSAVANPEQAPTANTGKA